MLLQSLLHSSLLFFYFKDFLKYIINLYVSFKINKNKPKATTTTKKANKTTQNRQRKDRKAKTNENKTRFS